MSFCVMAMYEARIAVKMPTAMTTVIAVSLCANRGYERATM
ncbi:MAG: hypothetical protein BWY94_02131 [Actinobacteria bacterium ADurb.BinA094]|nr:MAG: hypothetical protein BWY94_02131 [Actinobacteria bacterium ADurb.BinA094]